jgi:hypothetical protein
MARENEKALKSFNFRALRFLVRLAGIEPTTPWFVAKYSIQLSYSRNASHCSSGFWSFQAKAPYFCKKPGSRIQWQPGAAMPAGSVAPSKKACRPERRQAFSYQWMVGPPRVELGTNGL